MKKNKIYVNELLNRINNNQSSCNIGGVQEDNIVVDNNLTVNEKLSKLLNINGYIFNTKVIILLYLLNIIYSISLFIFSNSSIE